MPGQFSLAWLRVPADPQLDPYRPTVPRIDIFGTDFSVPVAALLGAVWGGLIILSTFRLFAALAASRKAGDAGDADGLIKATTRFRTALTGLGLLLGAAIILGGYIVFGNTIANYTPAPAP
ncbi:hypothetical protein ABH924_004345 [Arthrobacter sp. GAS37]|uniref:hypothetical protein n=1 Tax=Arthrobacter sp. GAS37 TaxID=3156261 RepID=UPI0038348DFB